MRYIKCVEEILGGFMEVNKINADYSALESFRASKPATDVPVKTPPAEPDKLEVSTQDNAEKEPKKKVSLLQRFKNFCAGFKKFFINVGEYAKGTVKGLFNGAVAAAGIIGVDAIVNTAKKIKAQDAAGKAIKTISTKGKIFAGVAGAVVLGCNIFKAHLNATERNAAVDHRWGTGHNEPAKS